MGDFFGYLAGVFIAIFPSFGPEQPHVYSGYVEADYVYISPTTVGRIEQILVDENQDVARGDRLVLLDDGQVQAALGAARAHVTSLEEGLENIKTGAREEELAVVRAQLDMAQANLNLAESNLERDLQLMASGIVTDVKIDQDRTEVAVANSQVAQLNAQLTTMELPARGAEVLAAEANVQAAIAEVRVAQDRLDAQTLRAPVGGKVETIFYETGEVAAVAAPVVSILPEGQRYIIFYIPEDLLSTFEIGNQIQVGCDRCPEGLTATLAKIEALPEFTPPTIYSRDERSRLVFKAKAQLPDGNLLNPGQPASLQVPE